MVVATPCNNLAVFSTMDESGGLFAPLKQTIKKDPTRFELTEEEQLYWTVLRHAHSAMNEGGFRGLEEVVMIGNGMGMFQIISSNNEDEGTAGNISHRIEKFNFGPRVRGLVAPLAGAEQISMSGQDVYRYFIKVVPTKIYQGIFGRYTMAYQYSVTFLKKKLNEGEHSHGGILFEYEFCANVIEVKEAAKSLIALFIRLCAVVGGVFATSRMINNIIQLLLSFFTRSSPSSSSSSAPLLENSSLNSKAPLE
ncbi:hypothetical protein TELCIR_00628 [Teladorsagia circumcincta]|uniref:Endoplasmic reticulum vesicle transporter C-terminal domain-containing protein n=1 Tax=Teladorsagia circumcincta TaxID=45464 RepID=A0A2G9V5M2_TELCI|nr:hypothetical protein TELCIR_00628 [Teladorsagia circumcincta]